MSGVVSLRSSSLPRVSRSSASFHFYFYVFLHEAFVAPLRRASPQVPLFQLPALRQAALEFYTPGAAPPLPGRGARSAYVACTAWGPTLQHAFMDKRFYACTGPGVLLS